MKTATYRGRVYRLEYIGATKFGRRAKLSFLDGSKEFWVDANQVREGGYAPAVSRTGRRMRTCGVCGGNDVNQVDCGACA